MSRRKSGMLSAQRIHLSNQSTNCSGVESLASLGTTMMGRLIFSRKVVGASEVVEYEVGVSWDCKSRRRDGDDGRLVEGLGWLVWNA